jgi:nucleoside-diphosphate-sugar epimerase
VFFLAGVKFGTASSPELLRAVNVEIPKSVARRFKSSRIVAFSSGCVYPFVTVASGGATESTPLVANGDYAASCIAREEAFAHASAEFGTQVSLVRLNYATEFRYGVLVDIAQWVHTGTPVEVTTGHVNVIWQGDAVAHSIQALEVAASPSAPVNVTGVDVLSVRDLACRFGKALGKSPQFAGAEAPTAWLNNASWSHRLFGAPPTPLDRMIEWTAAWVQSSGETWHKPTGFQKRDGRY